MEQNSAPESPNHPWNPDYVLVILPDTALVAEANLGLLAVLRGSYPAGVAAQSGPRVLENRRITKVEVLAARPPDALFAHRKVPRDGGCFR